MFSTANAALWAESTAALEEDISEDAYRLVRKPAKKGSSEAGGGRGERGTILGPLSFLNCETSNRRMVDALGLLPSRAPMTIIVALFRLGYSCGIDERNGMDGRRRGTPTKKKESKRDVAGNKNRRMVRRQKKASRRERSLQRSSLTLIARVAARAVCLIK